MLKKFIQIKNIGRFKQSASQQVPALLPHVMVLGPNGFGKTTLCSILRSAQTGDSDHITGRQTLGPTTGTCEVNLLTSWGNVQHGEAGWTKPIPEILIFDGVFVAQNVHAGDVVDLEQKRNLYRVIIGQEGVGFAEADVSLAAESRLKAGEITTAAKIIDAYIPAGMKLPEFLKLPADPEIDTKITEQTKTVEAVRQSEQLAKRHILAEILLPALPENLAALLLRTVEDIADDAELQVAAHLAAHQMTDHGEAWLAEGMPFISAEKCPYCGQGLEGQPLIASYRALFSTAYKALKTEVATMRATVERDFGDKAVGALTALITTNAAHLEFWKLYCTLPSDTHDVPVGLTDTLSALKDAVLRLLDRKSLAPLESIELTDDADFAQQLALFAQMHASIETVNTAVRAANLIITAKKTTTAGGDVAGAETVLRRLSAVKRRHETGAAEACTAYGKLEAEKTEIETRKTAARAKLEEHSLKVVEPYERRINALLSDFNAGFSITQTKHAYPGGVATSSYQLVINDTAIDVGDGKTGLNKPSFKNTLSAGDRTTLALAFFLAHLERDPARADRIVVFDDPFNSQDAFRRHQTVYQIQKTGKECAQVIVLSHDATFLRQVWDKCPPDQRIAIQLTGHRGLGTKIGPCDLDVACKGRVANDTDDLLNFVNTGVGKPHDISRKMRVVLETFCRASYPGFFGPNETLGEIVGKIRQGGDQHPALAFLEELDQINDYSRDHHHGDDPTDGAGDQFDDTELNGFVRKTLRISNNLQG
jgi:wobble nucleotide-excising tRNase